MKNHDIRVTNTGTVGCDTGRPYYRLVCSICRVVIHDSTNDPGLRLTQHLRGIPAYDRPMTAQDVNDG